MLRKKNIFFLLFLIRSVCFSQNLENFFDKIREAEAKSAREKIQFKTNQHTANYDITYHRFDWNIDPAVAFISGTVTTTFIAKENLNTLVFDLDDNMIVSEVFQNASSLSFIQNTDDELVITLSETLISGESTTVIITYAGNPVSSGFGSFEQTTHNGAPIIWTLSEPYGAMAWWPCKQDLTDKIDEIDIYITTPQQYTAVSNGLEQSQVINGSEKTTHFKHQYPIPAYLIAIAVTNYEVYSHTVANNGNPFPIINYVYPENLSDAQNSTEITVDIMNIFSNLFEEYPYANEKYGHAQFGWGGGMEHTTVSFMGAFNRDLIAHELAHQWFGDKITCGSWKDIWLNEGFATYLTLLTVEALDGDETFKLYRQTYVNNITSEVDGSVYLSDSDTTDVSRIFNGRLSYRKGAMVLHMLRKKLGDGIFFQGLKNYLSDPNLAFGYAKTPDLQSHFESASGLDLSEFFNDWIYGEGYPSYELEWYQPTTDQINIVVSQTQSDSSVSYFEAPLPLRIIGTTNEVLDVILENSFDGENFSIEVPFIVGDVQIDPDYHLLSKDNSTTLNIDHQFSELPLTIYPSPASDLLHISKPPNEVLKSVYIYNALGQLVSKEISEVIAISGLSSGVYYIKVTTDTQKLQQSFLKQ